MDLDGARRAAARFTDRVSEVTPFGQGHINQTFLAETPTGDLVVQRLNTAVFPDPETVTANILAVHRHLDGDFMPEPVPTVEGEWLVRVGPDVWRAWRRVPGTPGQVGAGPAGEPTPATLEAAGSLLGRFHARLADLDPASLAETLPGFHDPARRLDALRTVVARDPCGRVEAVRAEIDAVLAAEPLAVLAAGLTARVPRRVAHYDAKLDNILFAGDDAVCLVDFDTVMPGAWFWDVGDLLRSAAAPGAEDDPDPGRATVDRLRYNAILAGYRSGVGGEPGQGVFDEAEVDALEVAGAVVTYEQAVRFLTDWLAGDVYYRVARPAQNLDRARAQLRRLASMPGVPSL